MELSGLVGALKSDWTAQIIGAAIGVLVGYAASEFFERRRDQRDAQRVRHMVRELVRLTGVVLDRLNAQTAHGPRNEAEPDGAREPTVWVASRIVRGARPVTQVEQVTAHLAQAPDALSESELTDVHAFFDVVEQITSHWDAFRQAYVLDHQALSQDRMTTKAFSGISDTQSAIFPSQQLRDTVAEQWSTFTANLRDASARSEASARLGASYQS